MNTLSPAALKIITNYLALPFAAGAVQCPYYNNDRLKVRGGLRALVGKGSPQDILDEAMIISLHDKIDIKTLEPDAIKKFLVDHRIGVDCSALVYYTLDAEFKARHKYELAHYLYFPQAKNFIRKILVKLRPAENTGVNVLADEHNSVVVALKDAQPGDYITMQNPSVTPDIAHVVLIHKIDYENGAPKTLYYTHSIPWQSDGRYGHGVRQGSITIKALTGPLTTQEWVENGKTGADNETYTKRVCGASSLALRRLKALG
jgi:hypothetical protein